ncbi:MAG: hypothetical protein ACOC44_16055 [Promethearchaeia archaeon]
MVEINKYFRKNWLKILKFNENIKIVGEIAEPKEKVRVPLTNLYINPFHLYHLFDEMYPRFINDQQNIADVIVSQDDSKIEAIYLYETPKAGIHESYERLPNDIAQFRSSDLENIGDFFNKLQLNIFEKEKRRISSLRIFKASAIDAINKHCDSLKTANLFNSLKSLISLIQNIVSENLFNIYPEPNAFRFIKQLFNFFKNIDLSAILEKRFQLLPNFNTALVISSGEFTFILKVQNKTSSELNKDLHINIYSLSELELESEDLTKSQLLNKVHSKLKTDTSYYFNLQHIIALLTDLFDLKFPPNKDKFNLVLQKLLYGFRSFEKNWHMTPRPLLYNTALRFLLRLMGINLNLRKISHWSLPQLLSNSFDSFIGLNSKMIILLMDVINSGVIDRVEQDFYKVDVDSLLFLEFKQRRLTDFQLLNKDQILSELSEYTLKGLRNQLSSEFGFITAVIKIDLKVLKNFVAQLGFKFSKFKPLSKMRTIKKIKKEKYFQVYPEIPPYQLLKKKGFISLMKATLSLLIDKHEF